MSSSKLVGVFGGTFDPIHLGHLHVITSLLDMLPLAEIRVIPCYQPVHRSEPVGDANHRLAMTQLACSDLARVTVDSQEIDRQGQSYMIDTLHQLKLENPADHLCLILGDDAFRGFTQWHQWQNILTLTHLIIVNRPQQALPYHLTIQTLINHHQCFDTAALQTLPSGKIYFMTIPPVDVSATLIRQQLSQQIFDESQLPLTIIDYIKRHKLYVF